MDALLSARSLLSDTIRKSYSISSAIEASASSLHKLGSDLLLSSENLCSLRRRISTLSAVTLNADHAAGPASAVLTAYSSVLLHQRSLEAADPTGDLSGYLDTLRRLEQALAFLTRNCELAVRWLNDAVPLLDESSADDDGYLLSVKKSLRILKELEAMEIRARLPGGMLCLAMDELELALRRILTAEISDSPKCGADAAMTIVLAGKLSPIIDRLRANGRDEIAGRIYVEVRVSAVRSRIFRSGSDLSYVRLNVTDFDTALSLEDLISQWVKDMEFVVKDAVQFEHELCRNLSDALGSSISMNCYAEILAQSGFLDLLQFGSKVVATKKDAIKLLKLLEVFAVLDSLRSDFNRLFGGKECLQIQTLTRDLIRKVVEGASEIFNELTAQVERQRYSNPPSMNGGVPRLVTFVTEFCLLLLNQKFKPILVQVLSIHRIWHHQEKYNESMLRDELCRILTVLELNMEKWSSSFDDTSLASFFLMNNYLYLHQNLKETELEALMADEHLKVYCNKAEYYTAAYLKETWAKLPSFLSAGELAKRRLREFNEAFEYLFQRQSRWVISDKSLRDNARRLIAQTVVPAYKSYLLKYVYLMERESSPAKYVKYSVASMEAMFGSMFEPNVDRVLSAKEPQLMSKLRSAVVNQLRAAPITT